MSAEHETGPREPGAINKTLRRYVERSAASDRWEHKQLARELYIWSDVFRFYWFKPREPFQPEIPNLVIGIEPLPINTLAHYHLKENAVGLPYEISLNERYINRPLWETLETMLHEMIHLYQENTAGMRPRKHGWHNLQFVEIAEEIGLHPYPGVGAHWRPADGQFARLMARYEVEKPRHADRDFAKPDDKGKPPFWWDDDRGSRKGSSTLVLYVCESCTRKPPCKVRSGRSDLDLKCNRCDGVFRPQA